MVTVPTRCKKYLITNILLKMAGHIDLVNALKIEQVEKSHEPRKNHLYIPNSFIITVVFIHSR